MSQKKVLITGGSSGIGYELSTYFAQDNFHLLWVAYSEEELKIAQKKIQKEFPNVEVSLLVQDLSLEGSAQKVYNWVQEKEWTLDVLVNNAGVGTYGYLLEIPLEKEVKMLSLNIQNTYLLTRLFLKDMMRRNEGKIMNISSGTALYPFPHMAAYSASKAFIKQFSQSIREELEQQKSKVKIITVCPTAIKNTEFQNQAKMQGVKTFSSFSTATPEEVAKDAYQGLQKGKNLVITGKVFRISRMIQGLVPNFLLKMALRNEMKKA